MPKIIRVISNSKIKIATLIIFLIAAFLYMVAIMPSGTVRCIEGRCGMHFWGAHEHDGIWHVALTNVSFNSFPFIFPTFSGAYLSGYNFILDFFLKVISMTSISSWDLYFRVQPSLWFMITSYLLYLYSTLLHKNKVHTLLTIFTTFFATSLGFLIQINRHGYIWDSAGTPSMQGALAMTNPQFMWSITMILLLIIVLEKRKKSIYVALLAFVILGLKIYALAPLFVIFAFYFVRWARRKEWALLASVAVSLLIAATLAFFIFYVGNSGSGLYFSPLSVPRQLTEDPNMWPVASIVSDWYALSASGRVGPRMMWVSAQIMGYFLIFNYGLRIIGVVALVKVIKSKIFDKISFHIVLWFSIVLVCTALTTLFIQSGDWWNTIQFSYYGFIFANFLLAETIYIMIRRFKIVGYGLMLICIVFFLPAQADIVHKFYLGESNYISQKELSLLEQLKAYPDGVVMVQPFRENFAEGVLPGIYDTAYVSAITHKQAYYADKKQLELLNVNYSNRKEYLEKIESCPMDDIISYVYLRKSNYSFKTLDMCMKNNGHFTLGDENSEAKIWRRNSL